MKVRLSTLAISAAFGLAMAQTPPPNPPAQEAPQQATPAMSNTKAPSDVKASPKAEISSPAEMRTTTFKGSLIDMSCASKPAAGAPAASAPTAEDSNSANRSGGDASCGASASSTELGMKLTDGRTVRFDLVGNQRAQEALKSDKGWNKNLASGKPIRATVSGVLNGDKLIVSSIH